MNEELFYETTNFAVFAPTKPHVSREEGGHLCIVHKEAKKYKSRLDLTPREAKELIRLSMLAGEAMLRGLKNRGIEIARINYQENGNWSFLRHEQPFFHLHLYGRTTDSHRQHWGEALYLPDPNTNFYNCNIPLNRDDISEILSQFKKLEYSPKYAPENW